MNATALIALLSLGLLLRRWRDRSSTAETHPAGPTPPTLSPSGADRLCDETVRLCAPCEWFVRVKSAYERGEIDESYALYLLECD